MSSPPLRILITGSSTGLGAMAARALLVSNPSHTIYLHARNETRASDARSEVPGAAGVLTGDLSTYSGIRSLATQISALDAPLDTVIHNAGLYLGPYRATDDGYPSLFMVNVVAPYVLTCEAARAGPAKLPKRLVYLTSGMAGSGRADVEVDFGWRERREAGWRDMRAYSSSKLWNIMFAKWFARRFVEMGAVTMTNALDPGWVPTRMGGPAAPDDIGAAVRTYVMLAEGRGESKEASGRSWYQEREASVPASADDLQLQDALIRKLEEVTGVKAPSL